MLWADPVLIWGRGVGLRADENGGAPHAAALRHWSMLRLRRSAGVQFAVKAGAPAALYFTVT